MYIGVSKFFFFSLKEKKLILSFIINAFNYDDQDGTCSVHLFMSWP